MREPRATVGGPGAGTGVHTLAPPSIPTPLTTPPADAVYDRLRAGFERARSASPDAVRRSRLVLARRGARMRVAGHRLYGLLNRAFAHLWQRTGGAGAPELTIDVWDETETGVGCEGCEPFEELALPAAVDHSADGNRVSHRKAQLWLAFDRGRRHIVGWCADARRLTQHQTGRPFHSELLLWHSDRGVPVIHAGLVARGRAGVLLAGPSGCGKSTTALACLRAGFRYLSDDCVGLEERGDRTFIGHSLFGSMTLDPEHVGRCAPLTGHGIAGRVPWEDKLLVLLSDVWPERMARRAHIRAIALPRVVDAATTTLRPAPEREALMRLAPSSLPMVPRTAVGRTLDRLRNLVRATPSFRLDVGRDADRLADRLGAVLDP